MKHINIITFGIALCISFLYAPHAAFAAITDFTVVPTPQFPAVTAHTFEVNTSCGEKIESDLDPETHFVFTPISPGGVSSVMLYFHGDGNYDFDDFCSGGSAAKEGAEYLGACHAITDNPNAAIIALTRPSSVGNSSGNWFRGTITADQTTCMISELRDVLAQASVPSEAAMVYGGWSGGGGTIANLIPYLPASTVSLFDACYPNWCNTIIDSSNALNVFFYNNVIDDTEGSSAYTAIARNPSKATSYILQGKSHRDVPGLCALDAITDGPPCYGAAVRDTEAGTGSNNVTALTSGGNGGSRVSPIDIGRIRLGLPNLGINIPGLSFSSLSEEELVRVADDGSTYIRNPYLAEYIAAIFRYAVGIITIITSLVIIVSGLQWMTSAGGDAISKAKTRITTAIIGLVLALSSYTILFIINPDLIRLSTLEVQYIAGEPVGGDSAFVNYGNFSSSLRAGSLSSISAYLDTIQEPSWNEVTEFDCNNRPAPAGVLDPSLTETYTCPGIEGSITTIPIMKNAVCAAGAIADQRGYILDIVSSYRPFSRQADLWCDSSHPLSERRSYVSLPGHSNHGHGVALDVKLKDKQTGRDLTEFGSSAQCSVPDEAVRALAEVFYAADINFVRYETEIWHFEFGTGALSNRDKYTSRPASKCRDVSTNTLSATTAPDSLEALTSSLSQQTNRCTFTERRYNTNTRRSEASPIFGERYTGTLTDAIALDARVVSAVDPRCTVCEEDQVTIPYNGGSFKICWAYEEDVRAIISEIEASSFTLETALGYRPLRSGGSRDAAGIYQGVGGHYYGMGMDINRAHNGLYRGSGCKSNFDARTQGPSALAGADCTLGSGVGGVWDPLTKPNQSIQYGGVVETAYRNRGWQWGGLAGGSLPGPDFMDFSVYGYNFSSN